MPGACASALAFSISAGDNPRASIHGPESTPYQIPPNRKLAAAAARTAQ
jgi:hypothetical protein